LHESISNYMKMFKKTSKSNRDSSLFILPGWATKQTGGAEWQCYLMSEELVKRGWAISVLTQAGRIVHENYFNSNITYKYYRQKVLRSRTLAAILLFLKLLRSTSCYYYVRTDARMERGVVRIFCKLFRRKYIFGIGSEEDVYNTNYLQKLGNVRFSISYLCKVLDAVLVELIIHNGIKADLIIAQNEDQQKKLFNNTGLSSVVIHNSAAEEWQKFEDIQKHNIVLWVGNMRPVKRPDLFMKLAVQFSNVSDWEFIMIGDKGGYESQLNSIKSNSFSCLGPLTYAETMKWFGRAKVLVNTSDYEGFSNTFIQAWLTKTWILSLNVDPDDLLTKHERGTFCHGALEELGQRLESIFHSGIDESKLDQSYAWAEKIFSLKRNIDCFENELYQLNSALPF